MDRGQLAALLIDGQSIEQFTAAIIMGLVGLIASLLLQIFKSSKKIRTNGGFRIARWLQDNWVRVLFSLLIIVVGAAKGELVSKHCGDWGPVGLGFMTDKVIEALTKLKGTFNFTKNDSTSNTV